ncbi:MAG: RNA polymerase factor sigma-54 [Thermodesulfobacteriota bacterium]|nr:RNA polymerase factor sigma-54 [Thermodesulfobacteriota bacterium]
MLEIRQQLKLAQQLVMTPQLQQAIKLLQLSRLELAESIQQEIEQNPLLEEEVSLPESAADTDQETPQKPETAETKEKTSEVDISDTTLSEINWSDYANEYEAVPQYKAKDFSELPSRFDLLTQKPNLQSHLTWQLNLSEVTENELDVGLFIIGNLNMNGFLDVSLDEIAHATNCGEDVAQKMIEKIQQMDPAGVGGRDVRESLLLQLERLNLGNSLPSDIVSNHLHLLETKNYAAIGRAIRHSMADVLAAVKIIVGLDPHPGRFYSDEEPQYIIPDVYVQKVSGEYIILLNDEGLPRLRISNYYKEILKNKKSTPAETREYIQDKLKSAAWLIKCIHQRQRTIYKVVESILTFQKEFFERGVAFLRPLVLRDVAEDISMHESTVSRVTTNKYVHTPQGIFELKYFFTSSIQREGGEALSSESIKERIRLITQAEDPDKPLSDKAISEIFAREQIKVARRTVAKYREQIGILPSKYRKRPKMSI